MSANLINLRTIQFSDKFALLSQQYGSRLQGLVARASTRASRASPVNQVAPTAAVPVTERCTPIDRQDATFDRRWVFPLPYEHAQLVDKFDELQMLGDPKPSLVMNAANAMGRAKDDVILGAFFSNREDRRARFRLGRLRHHAHHLGWAERLGEPRCFRGDQPHRR